MATNIIYLKKTIHKAFFAQKRHDVITKDPFEEGDAIVLCAVCKSAFTIDSWEYLKKMHCGQSNTLTSIPINEFPKIFSRPSITTFYPLLPVVYEGFPIQLHWSVENADSCKINQDIGKVALKGYLDVSISGLGYKTFTLTASKGHHKIQKNIKVRVVPLPTIQTIQLPAPILLKQPSVIKPLNIYLFFNREHSIRIKSKPFGQKISKLKIGLLNYIRRIKHILTKFK